MVGAAERLGVSPDQPSSVAQEALWAQRGAAGDRDALRAIALAHQDAVYRLLLRLAGERELALDLAQDTFVKAFQAMPSFRAGAAMRPWLFKIANNLFLDHVRKRQPASLEELAEAGEDPGAEDPQLTRLGEGLDLAQALAQLPVTWRQALVLRHDDDMTYDQIADVLSVPIGTVKTWLYRGRERLKELLAGKEEA